MSTATFSEVRKNFKRYCDEAVDDAETIVVTRERGQNVVIMSEAEWEDIQETMFFLADENRMERLKTSMEDKEAEKTHRFESVEDLRKQADNDARH